MVFQEPMSSLNPVFTIGDQVAEGFRIHQGFSVRNAWNNAVEALSQVKIPDPAKTARQYPHELSGGMRQRVMIAIALSGQPDLLIADEPTTALDVTVQAQILELMEELKQRLKSAIILISHNMGVIASICNQVAVMYAGMIVEYAPVKNLFANPRHPYTIGLLESIPKLGEAGGGKPLSPISGTVPDPVHFPTGCRFHPRCSRARPDCSREIPELYKAGEQHYVRCFYWNE